MKTSILASLLALSLCGADSAQPDLTIVQNQSLDGTWRCLTYNGRPDNDVWGFAGEKFDCNGSAWTVKRRPDEGAQAIDLIYGGGNSYLPAIWKVEDDRLLIVYMLSGKERPKQFQISNGQVLRTFKRLKP